MKALLVVLALVAAACLGACGPSTSAGRACTVNTDCDVGQQCATSMPGGYCTKGCDAEGVSRGCPAGSVCTAIGTQLVCAPTCEDSSWCREQYTCGAVVGSSLSSCQPAQS